ncbi:MAG: hypothetical protein FJ191_10145 [Gammaproteobacteria bacterium]|nr:hypothetical protein [Gammaproteobacteria bacterium]
MNLVAAYRRLPGGLWPRIAVPAAGATHGLAVRWLLLAGFAGGLAEVAWIGVFTALTPLTAGNVLREITATVAPALAGTAFAPLLGLAIHFGLSALLGLAFGYALSSPALRAVGRPATYPVAVVLLIGTWAVNFLVLLPALNPVFVGLMPMPVTLASKALFGVAMAATLQYSGARLRR